LSAQEATACVSNETLPQSRKPSSRIVTQTNLPSLDVPGKINRKSSVSSSEYESRCHRVTINLKVIELEGVQHARQPSDAKLMLVAR